MNAAAASSPSLYFDAALASRARDELWPALHQWLMNLLVEHPDFNKWKGKQIIESVLAAKLPGYEPSEIADYAFNEEIERQHRVVSSYLTSLTSALWVREVDPYLRRFPFRGLPVTRESHLKTCAEMYYGRVYTFREHWKKGISQVDRWKRPSAFPIADLKVSIDAAFKSETDIRSSFTHQAAFTEPTISAVGTADMLSDHPAMKWMAIGPADYRRAAMRWRKLVKAAADKADTYAGYLAVMTMVNCEFLGAREKGLEIVSLAQQKRP